MQPIKEEAGDRVTTVTKQIPHKHYSADGACIKCGKPELKEEEVEEK